MARKLSTATIMKAIAVRIADRVGERLAERRQQMLPVEIAGEFVVARQERQPLLALVALVDDAHDAARPRRTLAAIGVPATDVFDDQPARSLPGPSGNSAYWTS